MLNHANQTRPFFFFLASCLAISDDLDVVASRFPIWRMSHFLSLESETHLIWGKGEAGNRERANIRFIKTSGLIERMNDLVSPR